MNKSGIHMDKTELLMVLCKETASISYYYDTGVYSVRRLADITGMPSCRIRQLVRELEADGMVAKTYIGDSDENGNSRCYFGWCITEKTRNTAMYKQCKSEVKERFGQIMHGWRERRNVK